MLLLIRSTGRFVRRFIYFSLVLGLFLGSAAVGAAYRDSDGGEGGAKRLWQSVWSSPHHFAASVAEISHRVGGLGSELVQFANDLRGGKNKAQKNDRSSEIAATNDEAAIVPVSAITREEPANEPITAESPHVVPALVDGGNADPLRWLSGPADCQRIRSGMSARYGAVKTEDAITDTNLREEFRHVFEETCTNSDYNACKFAWCSPEKTAKAAVPTEPSTIAAIDDEGDSEPELKAQDEFNDEEPAPALSARSAKEIRQLPRETKRAALRAPIAKQIPISKERAAPVVRVAPRAAIQAPGLAARKPMREPSSDSLAQSETRSPALGKLQFPPDVKDEPDEYRLLLRKGGAAANALERSQGY